MENHYVGDPPTRTTSAALAIGILLLPYLFVWFLLRQGHTRLARTLGFAWTGLVLFLAFAAPFGGPAGAGPANSEGPVELTARSAPTAEPQVKRIAARSELSLQGRQLKRLYNELERFRDDPEFRRIGFDLCCRFNDWKVRVEKLRETSGQELSQSYGVSAGDLLQLGLEYAQNEGNSTQLSRSIVARLDHALAATEPPPAGSGRATSEGWWCREFETWTSYMRASEEGDVARASDLLSEPACPHVLPNTATGPELERRDYTMRNGTTRAGFVRVKLKSGPEVWAPFDAIEFR